MEKRNKQLIVKLSGGLGNQLFQYAFAKNLQLDMPDLSLQFDIDAYNSNSLRQLELIPFCLPEEFVISSSRHYFFKSIELVYKIINRFLPRTKKIPFLHFGKNYCYFDRNIDNNGSVLDFEKLYLSGYFQYEAATANVKQTILNNMNNQIHLSDAAKEYYSLINSSNAIGVSVRIGQDYQKNGWPICTKEYYLNGIRYILANHPDSQLFIFADEIVQIKDLGWFDEYSPIFVEKCSVSESLFLLSKCNDFVISNSTFAWWGAYLNNNSEVIAIAPKYFYRDKSVTMRQSSIHLPNAYYLDNYSGLPDEDQS